MRTWLKSLFVPSCSVCKSQLHTQYTVTGHQKACPNGHYKEEMYSELGVFIVHNHK